MVVGQVMRLSRYGLEDLPPPTIPPGYSILSLAQTGETSEHYRQTTNRLGSYDTNYSLITPEEMDSLVASGRWEPEGVFFLLDQNGRIAGVIRAGGAGQDRGELHEIRLEPSLRGLGLGRALLAAGLHYLAGTGLRLVELSTTGDQLPAHRLALSAGFSVTRHWLHYLKPL
jgi:GNAT superfamily N-acetyltransferase